MNFHFILNQSYDDVQKDHAFHFILEQSYEDVQNDHACNLSRGRLEFFYYL